MLRSKLVEVTDDSTKIQPVFIYREESECRVQTKNHITFEHSQSDDLCKINFYSSC